jgi:biopolymer transport protein ExbB
MKFQSRQTILLGSALTAVLAVLARAQTAAPAAAAAGETGQWNTLWDYWKVGGICMWPIGACSVAAVGLIIYACLIFRREKMLQPHIVQPLREALGRLDLQQAATICNGSPGILANILGAGLRRVGEDGVIDVAAMEKAMEEASVEEVNEGMKPLIYLSVVSQVAPMFGLLGTVTGMIGAFNKIGMGAMGDPEKLAANIGEAMITTAFGLMVAIPAMLAYFGLKAHYTSNIARISRLLGDLLHHMAETLRRPDNQPAGGVAAIQPGVTVL